MCRFTCRLSNVALPILLLALTGGCKKKPQTNSGGFASVPHTRPAPATHPAIASGEQEVSADEDQFAVGDLLDIEISDLSGPNVTTPIPVHVAADGTVRLIYLDEPVKLQGKDRGGAETAIVEAYRRANLVQHADVFVRRLQSGMGSPGLIQAYDLIRMSISDLNGPNTEDIRISRVSGKGMLSLPYEVPLKVAGMTESQIETLIQKRYRDDNLVARAAVSVLKLEAASDNTAHLALTDAPIHPVPEALKPLYFHWPQPGLGGTGQKR